MVSQSDKVEEEERGDEAVCETERLALFFVHIAATRTLGNAQYSSDSGAREDRKLRVGDKTHGTVVVTLDPELDLVADVLQGGRGRSRLASHSGRGRAGVSLDRKRPRGASDRLTGQTWG